MQISDYLHFSRPRLPIILQSEVAECGVTCVAMIANYYGFKTNMLAMRERYPVGLRGITVRQITQLANELHFNSRVLKIDLGQLNKLKKPSILHWNFNHFVVLSKVKSNGVVIHDPAKGKIFLSWQQVSESFTGICVELVPSNSFEVKDEQVKIPFKQFIGRVEGLGIALLKIFLITIMLQSLFLVSPYYIRLVIDEVIGNSTPDLLGWFFVGFIAVLCLTTMAQVVRSAAVVYLDKSLGFQVKANVQRHMLRLPLNFFENRHVGDIKSRFEAFNEVQKLISRGFITAVVDGLLSLTTLIIMFTYQPQLTFISIFFLISLYAIRFFLTQKENEQLEQALSKHAKENSHFIETVRAITPIKSFVKENVRASSWLNMHADYVNSSIKLEKIQISADIIQQLLSKLEYLIIVFVGAKLILSNQFSIGMFLAFLAYRQHFADTTHSFIHQLFQFKIAGTYLSRISDIVLQKAENEESYIPLTKDKVKGSLEIKNLSFRYDKSSPWLFENLSFSIKEGEFVAITGRSGLGKTTLLKVITGLLKPQQGDILLDGNALRKVGFKQFRTLSAIVMQDDQLFNGSLLENITFFESNPNLEKVKEAISDACIQEEIQAMPMGLYTQIGDLGSTLSGGQKQRILLARALYSEPKILFMDEATSHLDIKTEKQVNANLSKKKITRICVAHREETIKAADRKIELSQLLLEQKVA